MSVTFSTRRPSRRLFYRPATPGRTAAVPERFFKGGCFLSGRLAQLFFRHAVLPRLAPRFTSIVSSVTRGDPCRQPGIAGRFPYDQGGACAGPAAVRTAFAVPGRVHLPPHKCGINSTVPRARCQMPQRCPRLDTAPSACWCQRGKSFGALRPGASKSCSAQRRGCPQPSMTGVPPFLVATHEAHPARIRNYHE